MADLLTGSTVGGGLIFHGNNLQAFIDAVKASGKTQQGTKFVLTNDASIDNNAANFGNAGLLIKSADGAEQLAIDNNEIRSKSNLYVGSTGTASTRTFIGGGGMNGVIVARDRIIMMHKMMVGNDRTPTITLAMGDGDTGFKWISDGKFQSYANNVAIDEMTNVGRKLLKPINGNGQNITGLGTIGATIGDFGHGGVPVGSVGCAGWFRSKGNSGWYSSDHGGGIYMNDGEWIRIHGYKKFYVDNNSIDAILADGGVTATRGFKFRNGTHYTNNIERHSHSSGYLVGSYNTAGANHLKTNPIYTIGSSFMASDTSLASMYGIGYSKIDAPFLSTAKSKIGNSGWGLYVAGNGNVKSFISGENGSAWFAGIISVGGDIYEKGTRLSDRYLGKTAKAADAEKLDGHDHTQFFRRIDNTNDYKATGNIMCLQEITGNLPVGLTSAYTYGGLITMNDSATRLRMYAPHNENGKSALYIATGWSADSRTWERLETYSHTAETFLHKAQDVTVPNVDATTGYIKQRGKKLINGAQGTGAPSVADVPVGGLFVRWE